VRTINILQTMAAEMKASSSMSAAPCSSVRQIDVYKSDGSVVQGILGLFEVTKSQEENSPASLHVQVACRDRNTVFDAKFTATAIQQQLSLSSLSQAFPTPVEILAAYLTSGEEAIKTYFRLDPGNESLDIQILERMNTGLSRKRWTGSLTTTKSDQSLFSFCTSLMSTVHQGRDKVQDLQCQMSKVQGELEGWKETAGNLEGEWEIEKTQLLENFLELYNQKQKEVQRHQEENKTLQEEMKRERQTPTQRAPAFARHELPACLTSIPGDQDEELYSSETVARLASGTRNQEIAPTKHSRPPPKSSKAAKTRINETTGAIEIYDPDALIAEILKDGDNGEGKRPKKAPAADKRKAAKTKKAPSDSQKSASATDVGANKRVKLEEDGVDMDNVIDKDMQSDIFAQLDALSEDENDNERERGTI
jgi:hypothetical protein